MGEEDEPTIVMSSTLIIKHDKVGHIFPPTEECAINSP